MARLNEVPVPTESLDALKRRFIRQNRELAKTNSIQSVRIRCLEAEVSRLLSENLNLREEIIQLRNDLEGVPSRRVMGGVQEQLEAKVHELGRLVAELGLVQKPASNKTGTTSKRSPSVGWGRGATADGLETDGRLPTIREDKHYPRRTLDAQEIHASASNNSESPDLGSPPVAHFQDEDPIKFDPKNQPPAFSDPEKGNEDLASSLSVNLETRRKRRDSSSKLAIRRMSVFHSPPERDGEDGNGGGKTINGTLPIRAGAKRKLGAREDEGKADTKSPDDFTFSRKANVPSEEPVKSREISAKDESKARPRKEAPTTAVPAMADRKALGEKSINTDPVVSPKKVSKKSLLVEEKAGTKKSTEPSKESTKPRPRDRRSRVAVDNPASILIPPSSLPDVVQTADIPVPRDLPPKTPATLPDLFSPLSTEPSTARPAAPRDTPPPSDMNGESNGGRAGRRARTAVNYAEPNLISKMRRPTKELMDAVGRDGRPLSGVTVNKSTVKSEPSDSEGDAWKCLPSVSKAPTTVMAPEPGSPLSKKSTIVRIADNVGLGLREDEQQPQSTAAAAISTLIRDNASAASKRKSSIKPVSSNTLPAPPNRNSREEPDLEKRDSIAIFDFTSSSPARDGSRPNSRNSDHQDTKSSTNRASRRHSSISELKTTGASTSASTSTLPSSSTSKNTEPRPSSRTSMHKRISSISSAAGSEGESGTGRSERAAARRRSMML